MSKSLDPIRSVIAEIVLKELVSTYGSENDSKHSSDVIQNLSFAQVYDMLTPPPQSSMGDLAFGCFILAKTLRLPPPKISEKLAQGISSLPGLLFQASAMGPYVNFIVSAEFFGKELLEPILEGSFFQRCLAIGGPRTMVEFSQPNTHKEIHVGHMRNASLGDAIVKLLRYTGTNVISSTFPGDVGTHVAKCLWYLKQVNKEPIPSEGKGEWLGLIYTRANQKLEEEKGTSLEEQNSKELTQVLVQLEAHKGPYFDLWKETRQWSIELMNQVYTWAGIEFDQWYWESDVDRESVRYVKELYQQGALVLSEGAIGMDLSADNLGFCLLLKKDGTGLYATKDIELARRKFQDYHIEKSIYVVDTRQGLHFQQVFRTLEKLGFTQAKNCLHLAYNFVELPDGAMSSRKGNIIPLTRLVNSMEATIQSNYLSRYQGEWSEDEIKKVAHQVAVGAIKYGMLRMDTNKKIVFNMSEWLKLDGDSGPFIQYSAARIFSLVRKWGPVLKKPKWSLLIHPNEHQLMSQLLEFHPVVMGASKQFRPSMLCNYLFETSQIFNGFYHECPIGQAETSELRSVRLALAAATGEILSKGLELLGIPAPERM